MLNENEQLELNALITGGEILETLFLKRNYPVLKQAIEQSVLFHPSMSLGLVIANPSSNNNTSCALAALKAKVRIIDAIGNGREESIVTYVESRAENDRSNDEFVTRIMIPQNTSEHIISGFMGFTPDDSAQISISSFAYHFQLDEDSTIKEVGIAICTEDNQIYFVEEACNFLQRKRFDQFNDSKLLADIIMTYTQDYQEFKHKNRSEGLNRLLNNLFTNVKQVNVI